MTVGPGGSGRTNHEEFGTNLDGALNAWGGYVGFPEGRDQTWAAC